MSARDPGLQAERTVLAWRRTAATAGTVTLLLVHHGTERTGPLAALVPASSALALIVIAVAAWRRGRTLIRDNAPGDHPALPPLAAASAVSVCVVAVVLLLDLHA